MNTRANYRIINDRRIRIDQKMYCYVVAPGESADPTQYPYFYCSKEYATEAELFAANPEIYSYMKRYESGYGTCLDVLQNMSTRVSDDWAEGDGIRRAPECDVYTTFKDPNNGYFEQNLIKMVCREYTKGDDKIFVWSGDEFITAKAFVRDSVVVPNYVELDPSKLTQITDSELQEIISGEYVVRQDLVYYSLYDLSIETFVDSLETLKGFIPKEDAHPTWNQYFFDYPIVPVLLGKCYVYVTTEGISNWAVLDSLTEEQKQAWLADDTPAKFKFPYDTYHFWMRNLAFQKRCVYGDNSDLGTRDSQIEFGWENNLLVMFTGSVSSGEALVNMTFNRRSFGQFRQGYKRNNDHARCSLAVEFNIATPENVITGSKSISRPVKKTFYLAGSGQQTLK